MYFPIVFNDSILPRRFGQKGNGRTDNEEWNHHPSKRKPPAEFQAGLADTKVDPVRNDDAEVVCDEDERKARAAIMSFGQLAYPRRDNSRDDGDAQAGDDPGANEHVRILTCRHQSRPEHTEYGADENASLASYLVTGPTAQEASPHGPEVVRGCEAALLG